jgi:hypothetical protein
MKILAYTLLLFSLMANAGLTEAKPPICADVAIEQAKKLLDFHVGGDDRISIDPQVKELAPMRNPANPRQKFQVLEVKGYIYKANYRMRLIYFRSGSSCLLMGQEVLEYAKP